MGANTQARAHAHRRMRGPTDKQSLLAHTHTHIDECEHAALAHTQHHDDTRAPRQATHATGPTATRTRATHVTPSLTHLRPESDARALSLSWTHVLTPRSPTRSDPAHSCMHPGLTPRAPSLTVWHTHTHTHTHTGRAPRSHQNQILVQGAAGQTTPRCRVQSEATFLAALKVFPVASV